MPNYIADGFHSVTPCLILNDVGKALDFYKTAFNAEERFRMPGPEGKIMHAEIMIGNSILMLGAGCEKAGYKSPIDLGGSPVGLYIYVQDVDVAFKQAADAGCTVKQPVTDMFWGDRIGSVTDPFGHQWTVATHTKDLTPEEIAKGAQEWQEKMAAANA